MKNMFLSAMAGAALLLGASAFAADAPPAGATAKCKDGTYYTGTTHKGACKGHKGVQDWLDNQGATASSASTSKSTSKAKTTDTGAAADTGTASSKSKSSKKTTDTAAAAGPAPAGATAKCKDGTYYTGTTHKGACRGHKGVAEWLDQGGAAAASTATSAKSTPAPAPAAAPAAAPAPSAASTAGTETKHTAPTPASQIQQKAGGGPGLVWVNSESKVYHCQGDEWYGKTKEGSYMTEAAAKAAGNRAARGKECGQ